VSWPCSWQGTIGPRRTSIEPPRRRERDQIYELTADTRSVLLDWPSGNIRGGEAWRLVIEPIPVEHRTVLVTGVARDGPNSG
jgi:hypothetical protein